MSSGKLKDTLTVGDVARRSGIPVSTIHFYETKELIAGWRKSAALSSRGVTAYCDYPDCAAGRDFARYYSRCTEGFAA